MVPRPPVSARTDPLLPYPPLFLSSWLYRKRYPSVQPLPAQEGRRAGTVGAFGQLPQERQHHLHRRSGPEDRSRDVAHPELRPQVLERNQGSAVLRSEEHTSELQSLMRISYAVFCLKKKNNKEHTI